MIESTMQFQELALTARNKAFRLVRRQYVRGEISKQAWNAKQNRIHDAYEKRAERITKIGVE